MFVAASTRCFADLPFEEALRKLVDLEFTCVEIMIHQREGHLKPSEVVSNLDAAVLLCRQPQRLTPVAYSVDFDTEDEKVQYQQFLACCKLAKATKVATISIRAGELGTPFNAEVERLRNLVAIAAVEGVRVGMCTEAGRMAQDPDTAVVLCDNVKGLGITLDPSHYVYGPQAGADYDRLMKYVYHTRLRDSNKDALQVRVGQGEVEYGRLVTQLSMVQYQRALSVDIWPMPEVDQMAELRKMRLLLESLL